MVSPPTCFGSVRLGTSGARPDDDRLMALRAAARAVLRDAGFQLPWG
jgi:hypothetical protein